MDIVNRLEKDCNYFFTEQFTAAVVIHHKIGPLKLERITKWNTANAASDSDEAEKQLTITGNDALK